MSLFSVLLHLYTQFDANSLFMLPYYTQFVATFSFVNHRVRSCKFGHTLSLVTGVVKAVGHARETDRGLVSEEEGQGRTCSNQEVL